MPDIYAPKRARVAALLKRWNSGEVTLMRTTLGTPDPLTPWIPGEPSVDVYGLDARVDGVTADQIDGTTILATDLSVIASPKARHLTTDGEEAYSAIVDIVPTVNDKLEIDGEEKAIKRVQSVPAAGPAALYQIFVAS